MVRVLYFVFVFCVEYRRGLSSVTVCMCVGGPAGSFVGNYEVAELIVQVRYRFKYRYIQ
jgi:hypothetical protein